MKTTTKNTGIKVTTGVRAGGVNTANHNRTGIKVTTGLRSGGVNTANHTRGALKVRTGLKAGSTIAVQNHNRLVLSIR
jgi:hypothetical protein